MAQLLSQQGLQWAADPFGEQRPRCLTVRRQILGALFHFQSDSEALLALVDTAYAGLPAHRLPGAPEFHVTLDLLPRAPGSIGAEPPPVRTHASGGLLCGVMDACNYLMLSVPQHRAMLVVSEDMLAHAYHVRYELIEFAVFLLAARGIGLVPLHGACVGQRGRGVLLLGASGAGKSTLALHSLLHGLDFIAERRRLRGAGQPADHRRCQFPASARRSAGPGRCADARMDQRVAG